ncbi:hypothetical protein P170DRAFT_481300 [Aspergillus steynii IBT 23096]|uniref:Uncharacterized protein n=1 Tax=Aspergillus steynii IBT 23096 TaxID=1392250 RepID=A0A2I2FRV4_9EURO|nr:uncharacterized protein P170DRAFT_481300 [Aspergillus steynii IBT 23096]PLB43353.1 hypothetical protein P170DRAFT_481300 [Aspergillus steynii IBT 23096]
MSLADDWQKKLVGKKFVDNEAESVGGDTFTSSSLPSPSRVLRSDDMMTMEYVADRLNVHLDDNSVCSHVSLG